MSKAHLRTLVVLVCAALGVALSSASFAQKFTVSPEMHTGMWRGRPVTYEVKDGRAIYEGDIILDHLQPMPRPETQNAQSAQPMSIGIAYPQTMWPKVGSVFQVPYVIASDGGDANLVPAINSFNSTFLGLIQWVSRTTETNYVNIDLNSGDFTGECEATEGDANIGPQPMSGSGACTFATILHEMGHEIGLYHEQSRSDRDTYITVNYQNLIKGSRSNFDIIQDNVQNLTLYDYASVMEYPAFSFTRNGGPAIESIPAGMPLSNSAGYSAADIEGIERLYGTPPASVTVTSNPPGLQVIVDSSPITTPQVFSWALNSTHTLNVQANAQTLSGVIEGSTTATTFFYTYGRWNDNTAVSHTITVTPGNGELPFPATSPQVATYSANFQQIVPYTTAIFPTGEGSVAVSPTPQSYPGVSGVFFVARQQATLTATPIGPFQFYEFNNANFWLPGGLGANPKTFYVPDTGLDVNTTAEFAPAATVYTINVTPNAFSSNLHAFVDGTFWYLPKNFAPFYDSTWTSGSNHTIDVDALEFPYSSNTRYAFSTWSDGGTQSHSVTLPGGGTSYTATLIPQFLAGDNFNFPPCGGNAIISPASPTGDGFYPSGQVLTYTATPDATWTFAGWTYDLTGTTNPDSLTATDETLVFANFNTTNTPLTLTSISPTTAASGGPSFTLTLNGTGFTTGSFVSVDGAFLTPTFVSSTQLTVTVPAADIANPNAFQVYVENFPVGWTGCANFGYQPFFVFKSTVPFVTPTPSTLTFGSQMVGTTSPSQPITVTNTGGAGTTISIAASGDFAQTNNCPATLNAGANCTVNVTFTPTMTGTRTGSITITDTAANSPQTASLTGTGAANTVTVTVTPASLTFASQAVGTTSPSKPISVRNTGTSSTSISLGITGDFAQTNNCPATLAAKANCTVNVTFTPTVAGTRTGTVSVTDTASNSPQTVSLTGTGTAITVTVTVTPASLTFASQAVGTTSPSKPVTVKNTGTGSTSVTIASTGDFAQTNNCPPTLAAKANCTVNVTFTPTIAGTRTGTITVTDAASNSPQTVNLTGTGTSGGGVTVTATPGALTFTSQAVGTSSTSKPVTVKNTGGASTTISITSSGDFGQTNNCGSTVAAGASCTVNSTLSPTTTGSISGAITIADTASNSPQIVSLTGTGVAPVTLSPATLAFGSHAVGTTSVAQTATITNNLATTLTFSFAASGNYAAVGSGTSPCGTSLAAATNCTISVTFTPTANGSIDGAITVAYTGAYSPQEVKLTGSGTGGSTSPLKFTPATLAFSSQTVGTSSAAKSVTVQNTSAATVTISSIATTGDFAEAGSGATPCGAIALAPNGTCTLSVTFAPSISGSLQGAVVISDNATVAQQVLNITGTAVVPVTIAPASLTFTGQTVGTTSAAQTLTITNNAAAALTLTSFAGSGDFSVASGGTTPCGASVGANASCTLSVTFTPSATGTIKGAATITDGATTSPQTVKLTGTGD